MNKLIAIFLLLSCSTVIPQENWERKLSEYLDHLEKSDRSSGEVTLYKGELKIFSKRYGRFSQREKKRYKIASISKSFTAVLVIKLIEEGKISYDTKLSSFFSGIKSFQGVTIEHLLRHRSGIVNYTSLPNYLKFNFLRHSKKEFLNRIRELKREFKPGTKYRYSNTGYLLLSYIIERVTKRSYAKNLKSYITVPLKLNDTYLYDARKPEPSELIGYSREYTRDWIVPKTTHESLTLGAGSLTSTAEDLHTFFRSILKNNFIQKENLKKLVNVEGGYGLGVFNPNYGDIKGIGHSGKIDGFVSLVVYYERLDLFVVNLSNAVNMSLNDISIAIMDSYTGHEFELPTFPVIKNIPIEKYKKYIGSYESKDIPLKVKIFIENDILKLQGEGQSAFELDTYNEKKVGHYGLGLEIIFKNEKEFLLEQGVKALYKKVK